MLYKNVLVFTRENDGILGNWLQFVTPHICNDFCKKSIPESEKKCLITGKPLVKIGEEVSLKLAHKPGSYYLKEIIRPKYALPKGGEEGICNLYKPVAP